MSSLLAVGDQLTVDAEGAALDGDDLLVLRASSLTQGLRAFCRYRPEIAVVQQLLLDGDGLDLVKQIRDLDPTCEVIFVASPQSAHAPAEILQSGATDYLPAAAAPADLSDALRRATTRIALPRSDPGPTLMLIEDHDTTRSLLARILRKDGYRVLTAGDGDEALRVIRDNRIDLIITDLRLPGPNGIEVLREVQRAGSNIAAILTTGSIEEQTVIDALRAGAVGFLRKPIDLEELLDTIRTALDRQRARKEADRDAAMPAGQLAMHVTPGREIILDRGTAPPSTVFEYLVDLATMFGYRALVLDANQCVVYRDERFSSCPVGDTVDGSMLDRCGIEGVTDDLISRCLDDALSAPSSNIHTLTPGVIVAALTVRHGRSARRLAIIAASVREGS